jgi:hypothetical protein
VDAKPPASGAQRTQAIGTCIREVAQQRGPDDIPQGNPIAICDCAIDLYLAGRGPEALEAFADGGGKGLLDRAIAECRTRNRSSLGDGATARPPATTARPATDAGPASDAGKDRSLVSWFVNLPRLWGIIGLIFGGLVLLLLLRRRGPRDLLGPPRSMRPKIKVAPRPRQDPPR